MMIKKELSITGTHVGNAQGSNENYRHATTYIYQTLILSFINAFNHIQH